VHQKAIRSLKFLRSIRLIEARAYRHFSHSVSLLSSSAFKYLSRFYCQSNIRQLQEIRANFGKQLPIGFALQYESIK